jgi:hypothetical protein
MDANTRNNTRLYRIGPKAVKPFPALRPVEALTTAAEIAKVRFLLFHILSPKRFYHGSHQ